MSNDIAKSKINNASKKAEEIQKILNKAYSCLNASLSINGYGIYHDISEVRSLIFDTQNELRKALEVVNSVDWPTNSDYDLADM